MNELDEVIDFAKIQMQKDVNTHRGAYSTVINYIEKIKQKQIIYNVVDQGKQLVCDIHDYTKYSGGLCKECGAIDSSESN